MKRSWLTALLVAVALAVAAYLVWPRTGGAYVAGAQDFVLPRLNGPGTVDLSRYRGKPVVVDLFASWCTACQDELPVLSAEAAKLHGSVVFIGVDSQDTGDGLAMARKYGIGGWPLASDVGAMQSDYHDQLGHQGMPVAVFYSSSGKLLGSDGFAMTQSELVAKLRQYFHIDANN